VVAARNIAIVLILGALVAFLPGGGTGASTVGTLFSLLFAGGIAFLGGRLYREHQATIFGLGDRVRAILYGSLALIVLMIAAASRFLGGGGALTVAWLVLLGLAGYGLYWVFRSWRAYE
jgi:hypothetical protein